MVNYLVHKIKDISTVTDYDYTCIVSTFFTMTEPVYRCSDCKLKYKHEPDRRKKYLENMACIEPAPKPRHSYKPEYINQGNPEIHYSRCVGNFYNGMAASYINMRIKYQKTNYFDGGLMDWPAKFVEVINLIDNLISENESKVTERNKKIKGK